MKIQKLILAIGKETRSELFLFQKEYKFKPTDPFFLSLSLL